MGLNKAADGKGLPKKPGGRGLGKGIDALIPNVVGKDTAEDNTKAAKEQAKNGTKDSRVMVTESNPTESSPEENSMRMLFRNSLTPLSFTV